MPNDPRQRTNTSTSSVSVDSLSLQTALSSSTSSSSAKSPIIGPAGASLASHLTFESALNAAKGDSKSALEAVLSERNMLLNQNAQLWKLIEKQRSGYANVLRELERVRAERDHARHRSANGPTSSSNHSENEAPHALRLKSSTRQASEDNAPVSREDSRGDSKVANPSPEPSSSRATPSPSGGVPQSKETTTFQQESTGSTNHLQSHSDSISSTELLHINKEQAHPSSTIAVHPPKSVPPDTTTFTPPNPSPMNLAPPVNLAVSGRDKTVRESTISLPAEARQYISNMSDSPARSPILHRSRSSSPEKIRGSPLSDTTPQATHAPSTTVFPRVSEETKVENTLPPQPPTPRVSETPSRRPTDLKLRINGLANSGGVGVSASTLVASSTSTPAEDSDKQDPFTSFSSTHHFSNVGHAKMDAEHYLSEIELSAIGIHVKTSAIRPNERGKEVLSFVIEVAPPSRATWRIEKLYSNVLNLDAKVRMMTGRPHLKKLASLPDNKLFKDNAPAKVDQRKAQLEAYLRSVVTVPVKRPSDICDFFCSDIMDESRTPVTQLGYKEGYLTKRGKNFGGWKTRYFVLQGPVLEYYENRGGAHLGSINITNSQIGRQQRSQANESGDENEYRHAFLIIESKRGSSGQNRHVLCAESDTDRDSWVDVLVRYISGSFDDTALTSSNNSPATTASTKVASVPSRNSNDSVGVGLTASRKLGKAVSKDDIARGAAVSMTKLSTELQQGKLFQPTTQQGPTSAVDRHPPVDLPRRQDSTQLHLNQNAHEGEVHPASLPSKAPLDSSAGVPPARSNSELGHYPDHSDANPGQSTQAIPSRPERARRQSYAPSLGTVQASPPAKTERPTTPDLPAASSSNHPYISGPTNGVVIPPGIKFGSKEAPNEHHISERDRKTKSTAFWRFGRGDSKSTITEAPRTVFGVTLPETLAVAQVANLPAVVFRCIQYLEVKKADEEEGIYRLSGSSAVIKSLKDRFNTEGDVDLLASEEIWDPHAIAGLLKQFFRDLPVTVLTREAQIRFLGVMDLADQEDRITEMAALISQLPFENYCLLRALTAHLIRVVQNSTVNKMTVRNIGIVFSPTLGIPAGVFSLMLNEFTRVFSVDDDNPTESGVRDGIDESSRRNSRTYQESAADQLLGLTGRSLPTHVEGLSSDTEDELSIQGESESGTDEVPDSDLSNSSIRSIGKSARQKTPPRRSASRDEEAALRTPRSSRAAQLAAERGLHISTDKQNHRQSRQFVGLPRSPRPQQPSTPHSGHLSPNTPR